MLFPGWRTHGGGLWANLVTGFMNWVSSHHTHTTTSLFGDRQMQRKELRWTALAVAVFVLAVASGSFVRADHATLPSARAQSGAAAWSAAREIPLPETVAERTYNCKISSRILMFKSPLCPARSSRSPPGAGGVCSTSLPPGGAMPSAPTAPCHNHDHHDDVNCDRNCQSS
jgi:hypothetical protein